MKALPFLLTYLQTERHHLKRHSGLCLEILFIRISARILMIVLFNVRDVVRGFINKRKIKLYVKNVLNKKLIYKIDLKGNTRRLLYVVTVEKKL